MPRRKTLKVSAINITIEPPHAPSRYVEIFNLMRSISPPSIGTISRNERVMLDYFAQREDGTEYIVGAFARFTFIDPNSPWWDSSSRSALLDNQGRPVPQVRDGVGPNLRHIHFQFMPQNHLLVFDVREISPSQLVKGLAGILSHRIILEQYGPVSLTLVPDHDVLSRMLALPQKRRLRILLTMPNTDVVSDNEGDILERYESMGLAKTEQTYAAQASRSLEPDSELKTVMNMAVQNGFVEVSGKDEEGKPAHLSTKDYPMQLSFRYAATEYWTALTGLAENIRDLIRKRRGS
jgi:hypothetical protein